MGKFPIIGKKLRHGISQLGYFCEAVDSQDDITGIFLGKKCCLLPNPNIVNIMGILSHVIPNVENNMGIFSHNNPNVENKMGIFFIIFPKLRITWKWYPILFPKLRLIWEYFPCYSQRGE